MKKSFLTIVGILTIYSTIIVSCSNNPEINKQDDSVIASIESLSKEIVDGEVPRDRIIYSALSSSGRTSTKLLVQNYKKDLLAADENYLTNLKNMWMTILNSRVYEDGTEEEKLYVINEQLSLDNNLAHFQGFYKLLLVSKMITKIQKNEISAKYYSKNIKAIADVQWSEPNERKDKETELVYAKRTFSLLLNNTK